MKETTVTSRYEDSTDYNNNEGIELCGSLVDFIKEQADTEPTMEPILIQLSTGNKLEHTVKIIEAQYNNSCRYLLINGENPQVLAGIYCWVETYLCYNEGSFSVSYK